MRTEYHESALIRADGPFMGNMVKAEGALCPDSKRRNAFPSGDGLSDTFFSIPAYVYVGRTRVYGYVTVETVQGFTVDTPDDPATVKFQPHTYRKNHKLVEPTEEPSRFRHDICGICSQDIEGENDGVWRDRGGNPGCVPYEGNGVMVYPKSTHRPASDGPDLSDEPRDDGAIDRGSSWRLR